MVRFCHAKDACYLQSSDSNPTGRGKDGIFNLQIGEGEKEAHIEAFRAGFWLRNSGETNCQCQLVKRKIFIIAAVCFIGRRTRRGELGSPSLMLPTYLLTSVLCVGGYERGVCEREGEACTYIGDTTPSGLPLLHTHTPSYTPGHIQIRRCT